MVVDAQTEGAGHPNRISASRGTRLRLRKVWSVNGRQVELPVSYVDSCPTIEGGQLWMFLVSIDGRPWSWFRHVDGLSIDGGLVPSCMSMASVLMEDPGT